MQPGPPQVCVHPRARRCIVPAFPFVLQRRPRCPERGSCSSGSGPGPHTGPPQVGGGPRLLRGGEADAPIRQQPPHPGRHGHDHFRLPHGCVRGLPGPRWVSTQSLDAVWRAQPAFPQSLCLEVRLGGAGGSKLQETLSAAHLLLPTGNMDRHHYETFEKFGNETFIIHLDNGRG